MNLRNSKNVLWYLFGEGTINNLPNLLEDRRKSHGPGYVVYIIDCFFEKDKNFESFMKGEDVVFYLSTSEEPTTEGIDVLVNKIKAYSVVLPLAIVGIGGGICLDTAKAVSNLLTNGGIAEDYQ